MKLLHIIYTPWLPMIDSLIAVKSTLRAELVFSFYLPPYNTVSPPNECSFANFVNISDISDSSQIFRFFLSLFPSLFMAILTSLCLLVFGFLLLPSSVCSHSPAWCSFMNIHPLRVQSHEKSFKSLSISFLL